MKTKYIFQTISNVYIQLTCTRFLIYKQKHDKTNKKACAISDDSDQTDQSLCRALNG